MDPFGSETKLSSKFPFSDANCSMSVSTVNMGDEVYPGHLGKSAVFILIT